MDKSDIRFYKRTIFAAAAVIVVMNINNILSGVAVIFSIAMPLIFGAAIAFIINIPMKKLEEIYFPNSRKKFINSSRRIVCILASIILIVVVFAVIINMVVPTLSSAFEIIFKNVPIYFDRLKNYIITQMDTKPEIQKFLNDLTVDWEAVIKRVSVYISNGVNSILNSTVKIAGMLTNFVINFLMSLIFAIYVLLAKEKISKAAKRIVEVFIKKEKADIVFYVVSVVNDTFSKFISGQCIEAVILGCLCIVGMTIMGLPYALMVGAVMGATALIPMLGAYLGAGIGAFMIFTVSPIKALIFILFTVVLQQCEGNLIYPRVVGTSIGLPGILVFMAVLLGGGAGGVPGMLIGVPATAAVYKLFNEYLNRRAKKV